MRRENTTGVVNLKHGFAIGKSIKRASWFVSAALISLVVTSPALAAGLPEIQALVAKACEKTNKSVLRFVPAAECAGRVGEVKAMLNACVDRAKCGAIVKGYFQAQQRSLSNRTPYLWTGMRAKATALYSSGLPSGYLSLEATPWGAILDYATNSDAGIDIQSKWSTGKYWDTGSVMSNLWEELSANFTQFTQSSSLEKPLIAGQAFPRMGNYVWAEIKKTFRDKEEFVVNVLYGKSVCKSESAERKSAGQSADAEVCDYDGQKFLDVALAVGPNKDSCFKFEGKQDGKLIDRYNEAKQMYQAKIKKLPSAKQAHEPTYMFYFDYAKLAAQAALKKSHDTIVKPYKWKQDFADGKTRLINDGVKDDQDIAKMRFDAINTVWNAATKCTSGCDYVKLGYVCGEVGGYATATMAYAIFAESGNK